MKKLLALVLFIALMCSTLISCDLFQKEPEVYVETAEDVIEKADAALLEAPYKVMLEMEYESNNREINAIISPLSMEMPMIIDGNNVAMDMTVKSNGSYVDVKARVVDKVMYYDVIMPGQIVKIKANMSDDQYKDFLKDTEPGLTVGAEDFGELTLEEKDGEKHISGSELTAKGLKKLNDMMDEAMGDTHDRIKGDISIVDVTYNVVIAGGKYRSMEVVCIYSQSVSGGIYNITVRMVAELSYYDIDPITAPYDADVYTEMDYDDLVG